MTQQPLTITISTATIIKVVAALIILWLVYLLHDVIILLIASVLLTAALEPLVDRLHEKHVPRSASMLAIYVVLFAILSAAILLIVPPVVDEVNTLTQNFPNLYQQIIGWYHQFVPSAAQDSGPLPGAISGVFGLAGRIFGGLFSILTVVVLTFYLVVDEGAIKRTFAFAPKRHQNYIVELYERVQKQIGIWLRAQLALMAIIGVLVYLLLSLLGLFGINMPYVLVLAVFATLMEFVPYVGPLLGAIPAVFLAYSISPGTAIIVTLIYYAIHLTEANVFVPKIMERALGLSPIISIMVFLVGAKLAGMAGAFLAIPIATAAIVIVKDLYAKHLGAEGEST